MTGTSAIGKGQKITGHDQAVYELEEIWDHHWFSQADHERIHELISMLPKRADSLLDVGCGNGLFVNELHRAPSTTRPRRLYAVDRSAAALKHVEVDNCRCDIASLPFRDNDFEIVTCLEVVEHLPLETYTAALSELCRVASRWILISVPYKQNLEKSLCRCPCCATRFNPDYHLRSFDKINTRELFQDKGFVARETRFLGSRLEYIGYHRLRRLFKRTPRPKDRFPTFTICPMCGYRDSEGLSDELTRRRRQCRADEQLRSASWIKGAVKRLWPKRMQHAWIGILYERSPNGPSSLPLTR